MRRLSAEITAKAKPLDAKPDSGAAQREAVTHALLLLVSAVPIWEVGLPLLAGAAAIDPGALGALMFLTGIWLALPMIFVVPAAVGFSIVGLVRGPQGLRARVGIWWGVAIGVVALAPVGEFRIGAALLVIGLVSLVALPCTWLVQSIRARAAERTLE